MTSEEATWVSRTGHDGYVLLGLAALTHATDNPWTAASRLFGGR